MPTIVNIEPPATPGEFPPNYAQFGNKLFICRGDRRPKYLMASQINSSIKCYASGIKPPTYYPTVAASSIDAQNISFDTTFPANNVLYIVYAFYSSVRGVYSQISPITTFNMNTAFPAGVGIKQLTINGFFNPRDAAATQDIDTAVVGVQYGISSGYMCLLPDLSVVVPGGANFSDTAYSVTFDLSPADLENGGFDLAVLSSFCYIPPASKFLQRYGERIFYGGQRDKVTLDNVGISATKALLTGTVTLTTGSSDLTGTNTLFESETRPGDTLVIDGQRWTVGTVSSDTAIVMTSGRGTDPTLTGLSATRQFRGNAWARITLTLGAGGGWEGFDDSLYYLALYANGNFLGNVIDVDNTLTAYLDRDIFADVGNTVDFYFVGNNGVIIPSGYTNETSNNVPAPFPECAQLEDTQLLTQAVDEGQRLEGISSDGEFMYVLFNDTVVQVLGGNEINQPILPTFRPMQGRVGTIAPRSICKDNVGRIAWIGEEGICLGDTGGIDSIAHTIGCNLFFGKSARWMDKTTLTACKQTYSRYLDGFVFGGFWVNTKTISGVLTCTYGSGDVTGDESAFTTELVVGDLLFISESLYRVLTITSDFEMTMTPFVSASGGAYTAQLGAGYYGLLSIRPELGLWLMNGQEISSNILEYQDTNGQGVILCGDSTGVVKQLFAPGTFTDCAPWTETTYPYVGSWRESFQSSASGQLSTLDKVRLNGVVYNVADIASIYIDLNHWHSNSPVRDEDQIPSDQKVTDRIDGVDLNLDYTLTPVEETRYHALEFQLQSDQQLEVSRLTEYLGTTGGL